MAEWLGSRDDLTESALARESSDQVSQLSQASTGCLSDGGLRWPTRSTERLSFGEGNEHVERRVQRRIDVCGRLGRGAYGIVWKGIERRGKRRVVALKKCFNAFASSSDSQRTYREISYLLKLRGHVNVVMLRHVIRAKHDLDIYLVFEYMETDLHAVIRANLLEDVHNKYIIYQLLKALKRVAGPGRRGTSTLECLAIVCFRGRHPYFARAGRGKDHSSKDELKGAETDL